MKVRLHQRLRFWLVVLALTGGLGRASAQLFRQQVYQEPRWVTIHLSEVSAGVYAEGTFDQTTYKDSPGTTTHNYTFVGPSVGLGVDGSIYHPNFARYTFIGEGAAGWGWETIDSPTSTFRRNELQYLGWFAANVNLLDSKPFHANVFANFDHSYRDYDFFNRVTVDSWRYGTRLDYDIGSWDFHAGYAHRDEEITSLNGASSTHDDIVEFTARQERHSGGTRLNYTFNQYSQLDLGRQGTGTDHTVSLADEERFGSREQFRLNSSLSYTLRDSFPEASDELTALVNLTASHTPTLESALDLSYDRFTTDDYVAYNYSGQAQLLHRLYDSLTSALVARATDFETSANAADGYTRRFGAGFIETYTKQISYNSRLRINNSFFVDHTDQDSSGVVENERHTFSEGPADSFFLNFPRVIEASIQVTDQNFTQPGYVRGIDYVVITLDSRTQIQRPAGSRIPTGAAVLVSYQTRPTPAGSYETLTESFQIRFDLWRNLLGLYSRIDLSLNNAPRELLVQNLRAYTFGADFTWRWFRAGAEYEIFDSDQVAYNATRLFQSVVFHPDEASTWSFDFTQTWLDYTDLNETQEDYRFMTRYHRALTRRLSFDAAGGVAIRRGLGADQTLATIRPSIRYAIGKLTLDASYDYEYQLYQDREERQQHLFYVRLKRVF